MGICHFKIRQTGREVYLILFNNYFTEYCSTLLPRKRQKNRLKNE